MACSPSTSTRSSTKTRRRGRRSAPASSGTWTRPCGRDTCAPTLAVRSRDTVTMRGNVGVQIIDTDQSSSGLPGRVSPHAGPGDRDGRGRHVVHRRPSADQRRLPDRRTIRRSASASPRKWPARAWTSSRRPRRAATTSAPASRAVAAAIHCSTPGAPGHSTVSYEKYFSERSGYVSMAAFYKDLDSYIFTQTDPNHDFSSLLAATPPTLFPPGVVPQTTGNFSHPENGSGGYLWGLEFSASVPFDMFSDALHGLRRDLQLLLHRQRHRDPGLGQLGRERPYPAAGPVPGRVERDPVLRELRLRRPHRDPLPLRVHRRGH